MTAADVLLLARHNDELRGILQKELDATRKAGGDAAPNKRSGR